VAGRRRSLLAVNPNTQTETMSPRTIRITIAMIILAAGFFSLAVIG
jgi:hypothetical protein